MLHLLLRRTLVLYKNIQHWMVMFINCSMFISKQWKGR